jgi:regulator of sigma E protease
MTTGVAILGLALLVLIHEAGHFFVARAVGMRPRRFYLGFPPAVAKVRRKGIEYGIGAIPLGGYVKIPGMHRPASTDVDGHLARALNDDPGLSAPVERLKRTLGAGDFDAAMSDVDALEAAVAAADLQPGARSAAERGIRELRDALGADAYWRQQTWRRVAVIIAGPAANAATAVVLLVVLFMAGVPTGAERVVAQVVSGSPAERVGLRPGDEIIAVNGSTVEASEIPKLIRNGHGKPISLIVIRGSTPRVLRAARPRPMDGAYRLGFALEARYESYSLPRSIALALEETGRVTRAIGAAFFDVVSGRDREAVSTPVGVVQGSSQALEAGARYYLNVLALISLSLALLNLLPLLPLDGGHIFFSLLEGIRGRAIGRAAYERASVVGIAFVLFLFAIGLSNDISRIRGG